jgi:chromosome partitioning protein
MYDGRNKLNRHVKREVWKCFPKLYFQTLIPRNIRLSEAPSYGKPVLTHDIKSRGALAYLSLAQEVLNRAPAALSRHQRRPVARLPASKRGAGRKA